MRVVVAYDICQDKRRTRLAKRLSSFINRVQKSVFEGEIRTKDFVKLETTIKKIMDRETDDVRIYVLCASCLPRVVVLGVAAEIPQEKDDIVI